MKHDEFRCGIIKKQMKFNSITREEKESIEKMYENENKYKFLIKDYDSREFGYNYHVKIFRIDKWKNDNYGK